MRLIQTNWLIIAGLIVLLSAPYAANAALPAVDGSVKKDFARIVFSWPERVPFRARMDGRILKITFEKQANPNLGVLKKNLSPYIESASMAEDGKTAVITLKHPYPVRTFISSTSSGIDLLQINATRFKGPASAAPKPAPSPASESAQISKAAPSAGPANPPAKEKIVQKALPLPPTPVAKPQAPARPVAKLQKIADAKSNEPKVGVPKTKEEIAPPEKPKATPAPQEMAKDRSIPTATASLAAASGPTSETQPEMVASPQDKPVLAVEKPAVVTEIAAPSGAQGLIVQVQKKSISADFNFPWKERVAAAAFIHGQELWLVFSKPANIDIAALQSVAPPFISQISALNTSEATVLRFQLKEEMNVTARKPANSYAWTFSLSRRNITPETPIVAETRTDPPIKPHIFLNVLEGAKPISLSHPATGEEFIILPVYKGGQGVFPARQFVDAHLPRTAQGILVVKNNPDVRVARLRNGVRIAAPQGLALASNLPAIDVKAYITDEATGKTLFPYEKWRVADAADFAAKEQSLRLSITEASDPDATRLRRKLAELYLGEGMFLESLAVLNLIRATDPEYYADYQLAALRGAANFMAQRLQEAQLDFNDPSLEGIDEIGFWKRMAAVMSGQENKLLKFLEFNALYAQYYPPEMRRQLVLIAGDQAIGQGMYEQAISALKTLPAEVLAPISDYRDFMIARIYSENAQYDKAKELLTKLIEADNDRFIRARAMFTLATNRFKAAEIVKEELINELDALRIVWRGDQLELSLLELLGNLYISEKRYVDGLRAWKELVNSYPGTPLAQDISVRMSQVFTQLFREGFAKELPPLQALALYYEFESLTPIGSDGDAMIQDLADRLASVDLLDRAAALLEHQVIYRLEKEERSRVGARLALIYLLDKKPQQAIQVLELTGYGNNPEPLNAERNRLAASAYGATGDWKTALSLLEKDFSNEGKRIQMDIYWDNKDWPSIITLGEDMLASRNNITALMSEDEARTLMRLAVAYTMEGDRLQLQYLRDYFSPLMEKSAYREAFDFITDDKGPIDPRNIQQLAEDISRTRSFLDNYRASISENGLSSAIN
jgi:hypothetical protein